MNFNIFQWSEKIVNLFFFQFPFLFLHFQEWAYWAQESPNPWHHRARTQLLGQKHTFRTRSSARHFQLKLKNSKPDPPRHRGSFTPSQECKEAILQMSFSCTLALYQEIRGTCTQGTQAQFIQWNVKTNDIRNFQVISIFFFFPFDPFPIGRWEK